MTKKVYEQISHTADLEIRVYGDTKEELYASALVAMFQVIVPKFVSNCTASEATGIILERPPQLRVVEVRSGDPDSLLVDFLSEALYLSDVHNEAYVAVDIHELTDTYIRATLQGRAIHGFGVVEIKAVTYHNLHIEQVDGVWQTNIVFDI